MVPLTWHLDTGYSPSSLEKLIAPSNLEPSWEVAFTIQPLESGTQLEGRLHHQTRNPGRSPIESDAQLEGCPQPIRLGTQAEGYPPSSSDSEPRQASPSSSEPGRARSPSGQAPGPRDVGLGDPSRHQEIPADRAELRVRPDSVMSAADSQTLRRLLAILLAQKINLEKLSRCIQIRI